MINCRVGSHEHHLQFVGQVEVFEIIVLGEWLRDEGADDLAFGLFVEHVVEGDQSEDQRDQHQDGDHEAVIVMRACAVSRQLVLLRLWFLVKQLIVPQDLFFGQE